MTILVKILKVIGWIVLTLAVLIGAILGYEHYDNLKKDNDELSYKTKNKWRWHDKYYRIQIRYSDEASRSVLRKVNIDEGYAVYAVKNDDRGIGAMVAFYVDCEPNTEIVTSVKYGDGSFMKLECNEEGDSLIYYVSWDAKEGNFVSEQDLDGFKYKVDFRNWDFTKLDQEITLSNAK